MADRSLAVVGAGIAGLGAAYALSGTSVDATLFEATDRIGGRAVTRRAHGCVYDTGANYVKPADDRTPGLIRDLGEDGLVDIAAPVWTFTADGEVAPGDEPEPHKWTYESGIEEFARRIADRIDGRIRRETEIASLERADGAWTLVDAAGGRYPGFDGVLLTPPAPRAADIIAATGPTDARPATTDRVDDRLAAVGDAAAGVPYRPIRTLVLHYPFAIDRPYYALVNVDRDHDVGWLSREGEKRGHVPAGESLLIVQMAPGWSAAHSDDPTEEAAAVAADRAARLLDDDRLRSPDWTDAQFFRHALPNASVDADAAAAAESAGLFVAGDWVIGKGRVGRAFWSGHEAGERIEATL